MLVIVDLNGVLLLFRLLKDLSAVQVVTGSVQRILIRAVMFGYMELMCLNVCVRPVGKLLSPWSSNSLRHLICQL